MSEEAVKASIKATFERCDADGSSVLTLDEFEAFFMSLWEGKKQFDLQLLFNAIDVDKSGAVELNELVDYVFASADSVVAKSRKSTLASTLTGGEFLSYHACMPAVKIACVFGDTYQNNYDEEHAEIFADTLKGKALRTALSTEHQVIYRGLLSLPGRKRTKTSMLATGSDFLDFIGGGARDGKRRVYTYALVDDGLFFSETGIAMSKDIISKHAVHANANPDVRCAGTFRICTDGDGDNIFVLDNDSGTYRPSGEAVVLFAAVLEMVFAGLRTRALNVLEPQPDETRSWVGPAEVPDEEGEDDDQVYKGKWHWVLA